MSSRTAVSIHRSIQPKFPLGRAPVWIWEVRSRLFVPGAPIHAKNLFCAQCPPVNAHSSRSALTELRIDTIDIVKGLPNTDFFRWHRARHATDPRHQLRQRPLNFYSSCLLFALWTFLLSFLSLSLSLSLSFSLSVILESNDTHDIYTSTMWNYTSFKQEVR